MTSPPSNFPDLFDAFGDPHTTHTTPDTDDTDESMPTLLQAPHTSRPVDDLSVDIPDGTEEPAPVVDADEMFDTMLDDGSIYRDGDDDEEDDDEYRTRMGINGTPVDQIISDAINADASDITILTGDDVSFTILGNIIRQPGYGIVDPHGATTAFKQLTTSESQDTFSRDMELDTSYTVRAGPAKGRRLRINVGLADEHVTMSFRVIADRIPTPTDLDIPDAMMEWCDLPKGLIMVNGATGTGKTTTIAAMLDHIRRTQPKKIVTAEKPIEYLYGTDGPGFVVQREVGRDTRSFHNALVSAMRQAPNIILIGETRDQQEFDALLYASETGHLSVSTMHTISVPATISHIMGMYRGDDLARILTTLADVAQGFANQVLLPTVDRRSRFAVREYLTVTDQIAEFIRHGDVTAIDSYQMDTHTTMEHRLVEAALSGRCTPRTAFLAANNQARFRDVAAAAGVHLQR